MTWIKATEVESDDPIYFDLDKVVYMRHVVPSDPEHPWCTIVDFGNGSILINEPPAEILARMVVTIERGETP